MNVTSKDCAVANIQRTEDKILEHPHFCTIAKSWRRQIRSWCEITNQEWQEFSRSRWVASRPPSSVYCKTDTYIHLCEFLDCIYIIISKQFNYSFTLYIIKHMSSVLHKFCSTFFVRAITHILWLTCLSHCKDKSGMMVNCAWLLTEPAQQSLGFIWIMSLRVPPPPPPPPAYLDAPTHDILTRP